ncbi:inactive hydroxysteroid dehydrogenase-like protein 1 [Daphnia carinata]|uniref:inactive hydroxysteroid dehydrogenase-like protein 1 n=1 Tax=Daphnia carinata TaxID=120202 RepID=UPI00257D61E8|nr:inactive hydroxysteroid dehydrogenase-like protein 1 [Daphnia carinata]
MAVASDSFRLLAGEVIKKTERLRDMLAIVGLVVVGKVAVDTSVAFLSAVRIFLLSKLRSLTNFKENYGPWAIVTGATDGIGKEYARELARLGVNIILMSRSIEKLTRVAQEIEAEFHVETQVVQVDFSEGRSIFDKISEAIRGKEIGLLVNNVGVMYEMPMDLCELSQDVIWQHVNINMGSLTMMCWLVLPQMLQRRRGAIVNLSSSSSVGPLPYMNIYSASKIYVDYFSRALSHEVRNSGVTVQTLIPFYIATNLTKFSDFIGRQSVLVPNAQTFVRSALSTLGICDRTTGYWSHELQLFSCNVVPTWFWIRFGGMMQQFLRRDALKKRK